MPSLLSFQQDQSLVRASAVWRIRTAHGKFFFDGTEDELKKLHENYVSWAIKNGTRVDQATFVAEQEEVLIADTWSQHLDQDNIEKEVSALSEMFLG